MTMNTWRIHHEGCAQHIAWTTDPEFEYPPNAKCCMCGEELVKVYLEQHGLGLVRPTAWGTLYRFRDVEELVDYRAQFHTAWLQQLAEQHRRTCLQLNTEDV